MATIDLKGAYWHVPVDPQFQRYLAFQIEDKKYQLTQMPFRYIHSSPRVFTKMPRMLASILVDKRINVLMYLDD